MYSQMFDPSLVKVKIAPDNSRCSKLTKFWLKAVIVLPALLLFSSFLANTASAQEIEIDITLLGENINEIGGREQLVSACQSLQAQIETLSLEQLARLAVCQQISTLNPNVAADLAELIDIATAFIPEEYFVISDSIVYLSDYQTTNVYQRINAVRAPVSTSPSKLGLLGIHRRPFQPGSDNNSLLATERKTPSGGAGASGSFQSNLGVFVNGQQSSGDVQGAELQQDNDFSNTNFSIGADYRFSSKVVGGLALGAVNSSSDFTNVLGGNDASGFNLTLFGTWYETDKGYVDAVLDYGSTSNELIRQISVAGDNTISLVSASTDSSVLSFTTSAGRTFAIRGWDTGFYARLSLIKGTVDGFEEQFVNENLGTGSRFIIGEQDVNSTKITVGGEVSRAISTGFGVVVPRVRLEFESENEKNKDSILATVDQNIQGYTGTARDTSYTNLGVGASMVLKNGLQLFGFFESHLQHDFVTQNWIKLGGRLAF